jgi:uncharacterized protein YecA (UPF0149 family)
MQQDEQIYVRILTDPEDRAQARRIVQENKKCHLGGELRFMARVATVMALLSLGSSNEEVTREVEEFEAAQAEMDRTNGPAAAVSVADLEAVMEAEEPSTYGPCPCGSGKKYKFCCFKKKTVTQSF